MRIAGAALLVFVMATAVAAAHAEILIGVAAPLSGSNAWMGGDTLQAIMAAVTDLNDTGGLLGQRIRVITADDYCDPQQAVAAAHKLIDSGVALVTGHNCSGAAIPAAKIYAAAGMLFIDADATNPLLTEQGLRNVFRIIGRDDEQGTIAGDYLADHWSGKRIAIVHDGQVYGSGLAEQTKKRLNERHVTESMFEAIAPGANDYSNLVEKLKAAHADVIYYGGYAAEAGLILRQLRERGSNIPMIAGDAAGNETFWQITGAAGEGTLSTNTLAAPNNPQVMSIMAKHKIAYTHLDANAYAAIQVWAQAAASAGTLQPDAVISILRREQFDTVIGKIGFDAKGDMTGIVPFVWYGWKDGQYLPTDTGEPTTQ
jgi:branched-chain amino acid transport system substrate-binding protein